MQSGVLEFGCGDVQKVFLKAVISDHIQPPTIIFAQAMFAVPGWAVSASSLVQEKARPKNNKTKPDDILNSKHSRKRKRNESEPDQSISDVSDTKTIIELKHHSSPDLTVLAEDSQPKTVHERKALQQKRPKNHVRVETNTIEKLGSSKEVHEDKDAENAKTKSRRDSDQPNRMSKDKAPTGAAIVGRKPSTQAIPPTSITQLTPLQAKMRSKLTSARFRHLNETLYTTSSSEALNLFASSPELFADYHAGFAQQVKDSWPQNPVDDYVKTIRTRGASSGSKQGLLPLPRRKTESCTIADLGCGDAPLARGCQAVVKALKLKFHNYDLHAANPSITKADIANLPLRDGEADIAVFCLSLMGTNWISFVEEAWRILRGDGKGEVWVAEVKSRFGRVTKGRVVENSVGKRRKKPKTKAINGDAADYDGPEQFVEDESRPDEPDDETDISAFIKVFTRRGFQLRDGSVNKRNKMFVSMVFTKSGIPTAGKHKGLKWTGREYQKQHDGKMRFSSSQKDEDEITPEQEAKVLKPCVYKIR